MKKLILLLALFSVTGCKKEAVKPASAQTETKATVKFYSSVLGAAVTVINIQVNGQDCGRLKYSAGQPGCSDAGFGSISLSPGNYKADYLPLNGNGGFATKQVSFTIPQHVTGCLFFDLK